jgi:hypothetical protein
MIIGPEITNQLCLLQFKDKKNGRELGQLASSYNNLDPVDCLIYCNIIFLLL